MLKGLALTPPVIGRISIGRVVEKNGKRLPEKDDEFSITSQVQSKDGWVNHPVDEQLRKDANAKLRSIPVRLLFDDPDLNFRASYSLFDRNTGRPMCVGNGESCKRATASGMQVAECPSPDFCELAIGGNCKPYGRLNVRIGDDDELGSFVFRTTGFNSIRTLSARLRYFQAVSGGLLATLPLELRLRGKSTTLSRRAPIYYVDLTVQSGMTLTEAIASAKCLHEERKTAGFDQDALDRAAREGLATGAFDESEEDGAAVAKEFYPDQTETDAKAGTAEHRFQRGLSQKLQEKAGRIGKPLTGEHNSN
ncbi:hydrolase or metal-binding protein [Alicycliphilus denitrificans]|uniref:recombination directionality factor n=1 Tax=Alicycliphilus denitrificans TaxID=179636 RepID=UPI003851471E